MQFSPCFVHCELALEYVTYFTDERIGLFHLRIQVKEQLCTLLLVPTPFLTALGKQVPLTGQQFHLCISIGEFLRLILLLLDAFATSLLTRLLRMLPTIVCTPLCLAVFVLSKSRNCLLVLSDCEALEFQAH